jgi:hypothetical protein
MRSVRGEPPRSRIPAEILNVEGHDTSDSGRFHHCGEPGVMNLSAADSMRSQEYFPRRVGRSTFIDDFEKILQPIHFLSRLLYRHAQPIQGLRPGRDIPELRHVLNRDVERLGSLEQPFQCPESGLVHGMGQLHRSQQDVGVDENGHLPAVGMETGAAYRFIRERRGYGMALGPFHKFPGLVPRLDQTGRGCVAGSNPVLRQIAFPPCLHTGKDQFVDRSEMTIA